MSCCDVFIQEQQPLWAVFESQHRVEAQVRHNGLSASKTSCRPPGPITSFQTTRLLLSTLGLLSPEVLRVPGLDEVPPQLVSLDSSCPGFLEDLNRLDKLPSRHRDSALVFCMRTGQRTAAEVRIHHSAWSFQRANQTVASATCLTGPEECRVQHQCLTSLPGLPIISGHASGVGAVASGRSQHRYTRSFCCCQSSPTTFYQINRRNPCFHRIPCCTW